MSNSRIFDDQRFIDDIDNTFDRIENIKHSDKLEKYSSNKYHKFIKEYQS